MPFHLVRSSHHRSSSTCRHRCPLFSTSLATESVHRRRGRPLGLLPSILISSILLGSRSSLILFMCPNQRSLILSTFSLILPMFNSLLISSFLTLSLRVFPFIALRNIISPACIRLDSLSVIVHVSAPYNMME
ncbi:uncharacterized protein LOC120351130 [Nilaparvata lugens]|uniref:uncharacterized protein LOC120351130 n=1 Tax=Nilaparvata lugens TaxID=108931 RepID=UPI00193D79AA|nr:uncharacterized protein LOC120351130 [Nilaparvata lugens]